MYLAAFPQVAANLHTTEANVSLSVSSYFIGLAIGQLLYGPLMDRYGRKAPLIFGLLIYAVASIGCACAYSVETLIALRFIQAVGGCAAQVGATVMVRDYFPVSESAKIFSMLMLILGVSPLLAPTIGSFISEAIGWRWIFTILAVISICVLVMTRLLPNTQAGDRNVSLYPRQVLQSYIAVFGNYQFSVYALASGFTFAGLFAYVAGSPIIFLNYFGVSARTYGAIFALLTGGFICSNQINIWLHRRIGSAKIFKFSLFVAFVFALFLLLSALPEHSSFYLTISLLFVFLFSVGLTGPNGAALALAPFSKNVGTAAAMLGFIQMGVGASVSSCVGILGAKSGLPIFAVFVFTLTIATMILVFGKSHIKPCESEEI